MGLQIAASDEDNFRVRKVTSLDKSSSRFLRFEVDPVCQTQAIESGLNPFQLANLPND
jgi:hypothetical protein